MGIEEIMDASKEEKEIFLLERLKDSCCIVRPKVIAGIGFLGDALAIPVYDFCNFAPPTEEQRKNSG